ncbi:MAG: glycosyltransferase, partial [Bacteroidia bacterium]
WYPPTSGVAVNRMEAFVKYLSLHFIVDVYTLGNTKSYMGTTTEGGVYYNESNSIIEKIKSNTNDSKLTHNLKTVLRIVALKMMSPPLKHWKNKTFGQLLINHANAPYSAIVSSFSPIEPHEVALEFKQKNNTVKWVADMRDEMSLNPGVSANELEKLKQFEQIINNEADAITTVSMPLVDDFKKLCPNITYVEEVRNGYDHNYVTENIHVSKKGVLKIGYFGTFYGENKPTYFMKALEIIKCKHEITIEFHIYGAHQNFEIPQVLKNEVVLHQRLSYEQAISTMASMDINYMPLPKFSRLGVFSGKIFDYLSVQRPVIACMDSNVAAAKLITEMNAGYIANFDDVTQIAEQLHSAYTDIQNNINKVASNNQVSTLHRKYQVEKLAKLIHTIIQ